MFLKNDKIDLAFAEIVSSVFFDIFVHWYANVAKYDACKVVDARSLADACQVASDANVTTEFANIKRQVLLCIVASAAASVHNEGLLRFEVTQNSSLLPLLQYLRRRQQNKMLESAAYFLTRLTLAVGVQLLFQLPFLQGQVGKCGGQEAGRSP